ncbi:MAG: hypothetical protein HYY17_17130 [Planctomycetes bacterium]|nr:hypothetical protein [Planctomycetota bacterium]
MGEVIALLLALQERPPRPKLKSFNEAVVEVMKSYPADGTHDYYWPRGSGWEGTTQDLVYAGRKIASGDPKRRCYCCGLTFEVFFKAYEKHCADRGAGFKIGTLDANDLHEFRLRWFGASSNGDRRKLCEEAVVSYRLGRRIERIEDARPGDFVQLWRRDGSGHSVIFVEWKVEGGKIAGITYWSTQKATKGIGVHTEKFGETKGVDRDQLHIVRVVPP